ncbi:MAG: pilus assembly protein PilM [Verrucomicrobia bacterium]|nr:pilus assembly protein PilM [Verrucomicrobiota bacterium]
MSQKKALIVNLAASHVSVSSFREEAGRLFMDQFFAEDLAPGLGDDDWLNAAVSALAGLVNAHKISGQATIIAPSFLLLQKSLKVPQVERERQAQIVAFEAQNAIPYPLNEVIWDSQVMSSDGVEAEVLLFALRTEVATRIANLVSATGLRPSAIQAAPLLDSRAALLHGGLANEEVLIINVGARSTSLSFVGPAGANIQSANIGGNLLTQGVSDNTGQPFATAEAIKVGYYSGSVHLAESDPQVALLQVNSQSFIRRLSQDINRRLINVRRGAAGRQPTRILLTGRGSLVPGLAEQLTESLRLPVEQFDPSSALTPGPELNPDYLRQHLHQISEVIGEAASLLLPQGSGVNLIPRDIAAQIAFDARKPKLLVAALLAALAPWPVYMALDDAGDYNTAQFKLLKDRSAILNGHQSTIIKTHEDSHTVLATNQLLESVVVNRSNWPAFLTDLQSRVAQSKNTWVEEIHVVHVAGVAAPAVEGEAPKPPVPPVTKVTVTARILLDKVAPGKTFNARELIERQNALMASLKKSAFIADIPSDEIKPDYKEANVPKLTFTLVIQKDKAL